MTYKVLIKRWTQRYVSLNDDGHIITTNDVNSAVRLDNEQCMMRFIEDNRDALQQLDDTFRVEEYVDIDVIGHKAKSQTNER